MSLQRHVRAFAISLKTLGTRGALQWTLYRVWGWLGFFPPRRIFVRPRGFSNSLEMRAGQSSDSEVFRQVFIHEEYKPVLSLRPFSIIDLGANIGLTSAWFLSRFPQSTILAVEPDPDNYVLCCKNIASYGSRARALHGAAWSKKTTLNLLRGSFRDGREWSSRTVEHAGGDSENAVQGWDIDSLINLTGARTIDLLKIDIEKGELEVFAAGCENWISRVRAICIELHGEDCEAVFFNALKNYDFDLAHDGELTICTNLRPKMRGELAGGI